MRNRVIAAGVFILFLSLSNNVFSRDAELEIPHSDSSEITNDVNEKARTVNIDMQAIYGYPYNNMLATINLSHEQNNYVSLLGAYFKRSNDYGYKNEIFDNTSYNENSLSYTGSVNSALSKWIFDMEVDSDSRGMYDNTVFDREEKEKAKLSLKNILKLSSSVETYIRIGASDYKHRLQARDQEQNESSRLNNINTEIGGEYIWSSANRIRGKVDLNYYFYHGEAPDDRYLSSELIDDFNLTKKLGISLGVNFDLNQDDDFLIFPIASVVFKDLKHTTISLLYRYDLEPFRPEEFYLKQKYINPTYDLPPGRVHHGSLNVDFRLNSMLAIKANAQLEKNNKLYNYRTGNGNVLSADTIDATIYSSKVDLNAMLFKKVLNILLSFEYSYYEASQNITYRPEQNFLSTIKYNGNKWKIEWTNKLLGKVYIDPDEDKRLQGVVLGNFDIQRILLESFYAYIRIENLYNNKYNLREGYPEPGIFFLGGLRILI